MQIDCGIVSALWKIRNRTFGAFSHYTELMLIFIYSFAYTLFIIIFFFQNVLLKKPAQTRLPTVTLKASRVLVRLIHCNIDSNLSKKGLNWVKTTTPFSTLRCVPDFDLLAVRRICRRIFQCPQIYFGQKKTSSTTVFTLYIRTD